MEVCVGTTRLGVVDLAASGLILGLALFLAFLVTGLGAAVVFVLRLHKPGRFPGGGH